MIASTLRRESLEYRLKLLHCTEVLEMLSMQNIPFQNAHFKES